jgi:DNA modification methylase
MSIATEILQHVLGSAEGWFGVDDPIFAEERTQPGSEELGMGNQKLQLHPHVHCVVPAGGLSRDHGRWIRSHPRFLLPIAVLRRVFRGKFVASLKSAFERRQLHLAAQDPADSIPEDAKNQVTSDQRAAVVFTDPPYNVPIDGHASGLGKKQHNNFVMASGEMSEAEFTNFLGNVCNLLARHSHEGSIHFICMDWRHVRELLIAGREAYDELKNICVWTKDNAGMGSLYRSQHEFVFVFKSGKHTHRNNVQLGQYGRYRTNVWNYPGVNSFSRNTEEGNLLELHPTVKPVALVSDAIMDVSARGDIVLDSFLGSGTTLIACERTGRTCYGIELDPLYVDTIIRRWQKFTGLSASHAASGRSFNELEKEVADGPRQ